MQCCSINAFSCKKKKGRKNDAEAELMDLPCVDPEFTLNRPAAPSLTHSHRPAAGCVLSHSLTHPLCLNPCLTSKPGLHTHGSVYGSCCKSVLQSLDPNSAPSLLCYLSFLRQTSVLPATFCILTYLFIFISTLFLALNSLLQDWIVINKCIFSLLLWSKIFRTWLFTSLPETWRLMSEIISFSPPVKFCWSILGNSVCYPLHIYF